MLMWINYISVWELDCKLYLFLSKKSFILAWVHMILRGDIIFIRIITYQRKIRETVCDRQ